MSCNVSQFAPALQDAVNTILETMFFESAEPAEPGERDRFSWFSIDFAGDGSGSGSVYLGVEPNLMNELAAGFAGQELESCSVDQAAAAMLELANMISGGTLSRLEPDRHFDLRRPQRFDTPPPEEMDCRGFQLDGGRLAVGFVWQALKNSPGPLRDS